MDRELAALPRRLLRMSSLSADAALVRGSRIAAASTESRPGRCPAGLFASVGQSRQRTLCHLGASCTLLGLPPDFEPTCRKPLAPTRPTPRRRFGFLAEVLVQSKAQHRRHSCAILLSALFRRADQRHPTQRGAPDLSAALSGRPRACA